MGETVFVADIGASKLAAAVLARDGKVLARRTESLEVSAIAATIKQITRIACELTNGGLRCRAAGVAVPGVVRSDGIVAVGSLPGWEKVPLGRLLQAKLRVPVFVTSDRNAAVLGEAWRGAGRGKDNVIVLTVGEGLGAGIICGGRLLRGAHQLSGAVGWMVVSETDGFAVRKFGGLETFASAPAIVRAAKSAMEAGVLAEIAECEPDALTAEDIAELARRGNVACKQIYRRVGKLLGLAAANLISLFDPEVLVVGGSLASASDLFWDDMTHTALARCHPKTARLVRICISGLGEDANLHGAGFLAWQGSDELQSPSAVGQESHKVSAKKVKKKPVVARAAGQ